MTKFTAQKLGDLLTKERQEGRKVRAPLYVVFVEADDGSWCELDATSRNHAILLADNWVEKLDARGCSCRQVMVSGRVRLTPFYTRYDDGAGNKPPRKIHPADMG